MSTERLLIVEDERAQRDALSRYLRRQGYEVVATASGEEALERLQSEPFSLLITDLRLPNMDGLEVIRRAHLLDQELCVLLITAFASVDSAIEALRLGAHDYLLKPLILEEMVRKVRGLLDQRALIRENASLRRALLAQRKTTAVVAESEGMKRVMGWVQRAAGASATVLIAGETGTGKEVVARAIHNQSENSEQPFLAINLGAIPENMAESQLFGHERGAFTGAEQRRDGILRAAGKGTVFLDEVGELALPVQAKLLRALEVHEVRPLGSDLPVPFEARIIAATNRDLPAMVEKGEFRRDLFYRLNVVCIDVPPLRERPDDIPLLIQHLLARHSRGVPASVAGEAMRALCRHPWRGNVRELSNVLERALIVSDDRWIGLEHLPPDIRESAGALQLQDAVDRFERSHIALVLRLCEGNRERAAAELGISPATLYRRLEKLGLKGVASQDSQICV